MGRQRTLHRAFPVKSNDQKGPAWSRAVQAVLPSRGAIGVGHHRPALDGRGRIANRWLHRSYSCSPALHGTGRASVASGANAARGRCVHERSGPGDPIGIDNLEEGRASQLKLASLSSDALRVGHGAPIVRNAPTRFHNEWAGNSPGWRGGVLLWSSAIGPISLAARSAVRPLVPPKAGDVVLAARKRVAGRFSVRQGAADLWIQVALLPPLRAFAAAMARGHGEF